MNWAVLTDVVAILEFASTFVCVCGKATSRSLNYQRNNITWDKLPFSISLSVTQHLPNDPSSLFLHLDRRHLVPRNIDDVKEKKKKYTYKSGVPLGRDSRVLRTHRLYNPPQAQVDPGRHEGGPNRQATNLQQERVVVELVVLAPRAARVAEHLAETAEHHGQREVAGAAQTEPGDDVRHEQDDEEGREGRVGAPLEEVAVEARLADARGRGVGVEGAVLGEKVHAYRVEALLGQVCEVEAGYVWGVEGNQLGLAAVVVVVRVPHGCRVVHG